MAHSARGLRPLLAQAPPPPYRGGLSHRGRFFDTLIYIRDRGFPAILKVCCTATESFPLNLSLFLEHFHKNRGCKFVHQADFAVNRKKRLIIAPERCIIRSIRNGNVSDETNQHPCKSLFFLRRRKKHERKKDTLDDSGSCYGCGSAGRLRRQLPLPVPAPNPRLNPLPLLPRRPLMQPARSTT